MGGFLGRAALGAGFLVCSCGTAPKKPDLAAHEQLYQPPGYKTRLPADLAAFLAPLRDERKPVALEASKQPTALMPETYWNREPVAMLDEILRRDLLAAKVFTGITDRARPDALVVQAKLLTLHGAIVEEAAFRWTFGEVAMRIQVDGPAAANGRRSQLFDKTFQNRQASDPAMTPPSPTVLIGRALTRVMRELVADLDASNVARAGVPLPLGDESRK
jgi:hypothetical protein